MATKHNIRIMVQTEPNGPWSPLDVDIDPQALIDSKSVDVYIRDVAKNYSLGQEIISIDHKMSKDRAKSLLNKED